MAEQEQEMSPAAALISLVLVIVIGLWLWNNVFTPESATVNLQTDCTTDYSECNTTGNVGNQSVNCRYVFDSYTNKSEYRCN